MSRSTLLHALSLNDRILEPNKFPLTGNVWAYEKSSMSKESFVGNCISLLWLLGSRDATFDWDNDIMAFDTRLNNQKATILISLQDDSLASDYYYFLGVWMTPSGKNPAKAMRFDAIDWDGEDLSPPDISFSVQVAEEPLQLPELKRIIGGELFAEGVYDNTLNLYGSIEVNPRFSGSFMICPAMKMENSERFEIRHALYSLRNLMALTGRVIGVYEDTLEQDVSMQLSEEMKLVTDEMDKDLIELEGWNGITRQSGDIALRTLSETMKGHKKRLDVCALLKLFAVIKAELGVTEISAMPSLMGRMEMPFDYTSNLIDEELTMLKAMDKQGEVLQTQINNRILLSQQDLLTQLLNKP